MLRRERGFSMVEMVVAIAIIGILLLLAIPSFTTAIRNIQIRNAAESMYNGIQLARMEAMKRNARVTFWLVSLTDANAMDNSCAKSASGISWVVSQNDPSGSCATAPSDSAAPRIVQAHPGGAGNLNVTVGGADVATAASGTANAYCVTFNGLGQVLACPDGSSTLARVEILSSQDPGGARANQIRITSGGAVRMCDPAVTSASDPRKC
ncbi:MAG TPA: GspH/FimT family pseudopilin [Rhodocyclaceae bacterium]|nr:GspH/FimT family pseudopilin [Rhodocyclaceae bacterium]